MVESILQLTSYLEYMSQIANLFKLVKALTSGGRSFKSQNLENHWSEFDDSFFVEIHFCSSTTYTRIIKFL